MKWILYYLKHLGTELWRVNNFHCYLIVDCKINNSVKRSELQITAIHCIGFVRTAWSWVTRSQAGFKQMCAKVKTLPALVLDQQNLTNWYFGCAWKTTTLGLIIVNCLVVLIFIRCGSCTGMWHKGCVVVFLHQWLPVGAT